MQPIQQFPSWFSKQKLSGKLAIGCAGLFMLCCICSVPVAILNPSTPTPQAVNTSVAVQTEKPNEIPTNTSAPIPTLTLTFTPEPTITPEPTQDSYAILLSIKVNEYVKAFLDVNEYIQQASNDPSLILDDRWKTELGLALGILNFRADEMAKLEPTSKYANLHSLVIKLADETHLFTDAYASGVDNFDSALIEKANQHMIKMSTLAQEITAEMEKIKATP